MPEKLPNDIDPEDLEPYCPMCQNHTDDCICDDEEAKEERRKFQTMIEREKEEVRQEIAERLKERKDQDSGGKQR